MLPARPSLPELLGSAHYRIYRIAVVLCGEPSRADEVVDTVLRQSVGISTKWRTQDDASRWFVHYTVLLSRQWASHAGADALRRVTSDPADTAIIHAIGQLPMQQREAFLLHHGEQMDLRQVATAMDCSTAAAANHLAAAAKSLQESVPTVLADFTPRLPGLLQQLLPPPHLLDAKLQQTLARHRRIRRLKLIGIWVYRAALLLTIGWLLWWIWQRIDFE
jgi:DNA-directed RNA polymerase specialized sigma24 family protein